jgi:beta-lactamase regulating signal transducer with metallopeptidase domain
MTPITRALSAALLHFVWQGLGVTILLWLALFLWRRRSAALRYAASCAALALLVALPAVTTWILYERPAPAPQLASAVAVAAPAGGWSNRPAAPDPDWLVRLQSWTIPVWSCGVLLFSFRMYWGCTRVAALRRRGRAADGGIVAIVAALGRRMGVDRPVRVLLSAVSESPSVTGWLRPVILLPLSTIAGLTPEQLEAVLAHELAHIRRHDYLVNLLQMAAETLLFYHPAVWWISARMRHERELCCDDLAVQVTGGALCYARALAALEKMRAAHPALALGAADGPLFLRIRRLVAGGGEYGPSKLSGMIAITLGAACLALCVNWAHGQEPTRGYAVQAELVRDGEGVAVDTAGAAVIHRTSIEYPRTLIAKRVAGTVSVEATLDGTGSVIDAHVLSGPDELRKTALASVLNWHFAPGSGSTRIVKLTFQPPAQTAVAEPERKSAERKQAVAVRTARTPEGEASATSQEPTPEQREAAEFLVARRLAELRARLAALRNQPNANPEDVAKATKQVAEAEQGLAVSGDGIRIRRAVERPTGKIAAIEIRGLSESAGNDLLARLPIHEGDTLTKESAEAVGKTIRQFDEHLEFGVGGEPDGVVLRIHPAGAADAPLLKRK